MKNSGRRIKSIFPIAITSLFFVIPFFATAATVKLEYSAWLPYWAKASSTAETSLRFNKFTEVSPFAYSVKSDGTLVDTARITEEPWKSFIPAAQKTKTKVIPSILWTDGEAMHTVLRTYTLRIKHEKAIIDTVVANNFDGIDLDYEGKKAETKKYFSYFLQELSVGLHKKNKILVCTIEPRTPLDSRFDNIPAGIDYANDYYALNAYCDRVRIMAYDQGAIDLRLNDEKGKTSSYMPVADISWVTKVINLASRVISLKKIVIGVPTYGYEYKVTPDGKGFIYERQRAINHTTAVTLALREGMTPLRNSAGELSFTYYNPADATSTPSSVSTTTPSTFTKPFRLVWWSDASAIGDKVALAKKLGVRGITVFKIDGGHDPAIWDKLTNK